MSGGGGGSSRPDPVTPVVPGKAGDGTGGGGVDPCVLTEETTRNSPVPAVVSALKPGDVLTVSLERGPPLRVVVWTSAGLTAGSITGAKPPRLSRVLKRASAIMPK